MTESSDSGETQAAREQRAVPARSVSLWTRLKEHKVAQWALAYAAAAYAVLQGTEMVSNAFEWPHLLVRIVTLLLFLGLPLVVTIAWYHGHRAQRRVSRAELAIITILLVIAGTALWHFGRPPEGQAEPKAGTTTQAAAVDLPRPTIPPNERSIAVLPFVDMSEQKDQEYFADGMAEEIIDLLSKISALRVVGRTSSFAFKGKADDLRSIGAQLGAKFVVEGSVRRTADRMRITAQLISTETGSHVWSGTYDLDLGDSLKIQDEIAAQLVRNLQVEVGAADQSPRPVIHNVQAYESYLRARHARDRVDKQGVQQAVAYYEEAFRLDPSFMPAAEGLAVAYYNFGVMGFAEAGPAFERARKQIQIVLAQQPMNPNMNALLSRIHLYEGDWIAADRELQQALTTNPNDGGTLQDAANMAAARGRFDDAGNLIGRALAQDPLNPTLNFDDGYYRARSGSFVEADAQLRHTLQISPTHAWARFTLGQVLLARGQQLAALEAFNQTPIPDAQLVGRTAVYYAMNRKSASDQAMRQLEADWGRSQPYEVAQAHAYRDEIDLAMPWLNRAAAQKDTWVAESTGDPAFAKFVSDPRYRAWLKSVNPPP